MSATADLSVIATAPTTVDEAVELIWQMIFAGEAADTPDAARQIWHTLNLSIGETDFLALWGLGALAKERQRGTRRSGESGQTRPAIGYGAPHGKRWERYIGLTWPYDDAAGIPKPLLEFGRDDLVAFAARCGTMIDAYTRRHDWATATDELLKQHGVARVRDLPATVLRAVDVAAREAMGRQT